MDNDKINKKLIEIIKFDLLGLHFAYIENEDKCEVEVRYNKDNDTYKISVYSDKNQKTDDNISESQVLAFLNQQQIKEILWKLCEERVSKEKKYEETKNLLLSQLKKLEISDSDKLVIQQIIEQVCQLSEHVGMQNRVYLNQNVHLRLVGQSNWHSEGEQLHLQLVCRTYDGNMNHTIYPKLSFEQIVDFVVKENNLGANIQSNSKLK